MVPRVDTTPHGVETPTHWLIADWLGFVEPAVSGEDKVPPRIRNASIYVQLQHTSTKRPPRVDTASHGVETPGPWDDYRLAGVCGASGTRGG